MLQRFLHGCRIVFGERPRIRSRVSEHLVLLVKALRQGKRRLCRKPKLVVRFALQAREVKQLRRQLRRALTRFFHRPRFTAAALRHGLRRSLVKNAFRLQVRILRVLFEGRVKPTAGVAAPRETERCVDFPIVFGLKRTDFVFAFHDDRQSRRLHSSHGRQKKAAAEAVKGRHSARSVDPHEPVGFRTGLCRRSQRLHFFVSAQMPQSLTDRRRRHRLQPQTLNRLLRLRRLHDVTENKFTFSSRITRVDDFTHVRTLDEFRKAL